MDDNMLSTFSSGKKMISRVGQYCYIKNVLLCKEDEMLSLANKKHKNPQKDYKKKNFIKSYSNLPCPSIEFKNQ